MKAKTILGILVVALAIAGVESTFGQDSAEEVIERYIKVLGGHEKIADLKTAKKSGTIVFPDFGAESTIEITQDNGKFLMVVPLQELGEIRRGCDGKTLWEVHPQSGSRIITGKLKHAFDNTYGKIIDAPGWHPDEFEGSIKFGGSEKVDDKSVFKVTFEPKDGYKSVRYFDEESGLLVRLETVQEIAPGSDQGEVSVDVSYEEHREVDGIKLPAKMTYTIDDSTTYVIDFTDIKLNIDVDKSTFELPAEIIELQKDDD